MLRLDLPPIPPAEQLAADEVVLDGCEAGHGDETLLFWEPREPFVVVGYANKVATEVNVAACEKIGVPIFRRCSGGGTVVQMRGGLNYSLILRIGENLPTRNITAANQFIMEKNRAAIESVSGELKTQNSKLSSAATPTFASAKRNSLATHNGDGKTFYSSTARCCSIAI